ncbi:MAG: hypothetical protein KDA58_01770 [Planctomycetaceae bacterium]|nr:hypothetical protein [Planctomycetaceae bacterium]
MNRTPGIFLWLALAFAIGEPVAGEEGWGSLQGQVVVIGNVPQLGPAAPANGLCPSVDVPNESLVVDAESGGLRNVAVYLRKAPARIHPELQTPTERPAQMLLQNCRFIPRMQIVRTGQTIELTNEDPLDHSPRWYPFANSLPAYSIPAKPQTFEFAKAERIPLKLTCDLHPYMTAWWILLDHPYAAITDAQGRFRLENLPSGQHELVLWHERKGYLNKNLRVQVEPGDNALPSVRIPVAELLEQ